MPNLCPECLANLDVVGRVHRCVPRKNVFDEVMEREGVRFPEAVDKVVQRVATGKLPDETGTKELKKAYNAYMKIYMREWRRAKKQTENKS